MMLVTTSRKPGQLTRAMARTLADALGGQYLNRGKAGIESVMQDAEKAGASKVLFIWERHGNPSRLVVFDLEKAGKAAQIEETEPEVQEKDQKNGKKTDAGSAKHGGKGPKMDQKGAEKEEKTEENDEKTLESGWLKPEIAIQGAVYHRKPIRHKGAKIQAEDAFGHQVAALLDAKEGPNQIVLSQSGLKVTVNAELVLELRFRPSNT